MDVLTKIFGIIVSTFFTTGDGISISEVARIQAEHKQLNDKFWGNIADAVAGVFRKVITFLGSGTSDKTITATTIEPDVIWEYRGVAERNARTAMLMHGVKLYKRLQNELAEKDLRPHVVETLPADPARPEPAKLGTTCLTEVFMELGNIDEMIAALKPEVLARFDLAFWNEANQLNSRAAVIGKLLSEQGAFFRQLVKQVPTGGEQVNQTGVIVTTWERSYSDEQLAAFARLRDELQAEYNLLQKQLNSRRKQVKDAVRAYNLDEERRYQTAFGAYRVAAEQYAIELERIRSAAETLRQQAMSEMASLRVRVE